MKTRKKQLGYYSDPFIDFIIPAAVVIFVFSMILLLIIGASESINKELSPGVYAVASDVVCESVEGVDGQRCTLVLDVPDQAGADEISVTNHVLMLEPGEEYAETVTLIEPEVEEPAEATEEDGGKGLTIEVTIGDGGQEDDPNVE